MAAPCVAPQRQRRLLLCVLTLAVLLGVNGGRDIPEAEIGGGDRPSGADQLWRIPIAPPTSQAADKPGREGKVKQDLKISLGFPVDEYGVAGAFSYVCRLDLRIGYDRGACTCSLVGPKTVLTAAHCVYDTDTGEAAKVERVIIGQTVLGKDGETRYVKDGGVIVHPRFLQGSRTGRYLSEHDVALLILDEPSTLAPAYLASPNQTVPNWLVAAGWGETADPGSRYGGGSTDELLWTWIGNVATAECNSLIRKAGSYDLVSANVICGGHSYKRGREWADTCEGDSGGPLVVPVVSPESGFVGNAANLLDRDVVVGVTHGGATFDFTVSSYYDMHLVCGSEGIGTYASVLYNYDWLLQQIEKYGLEVEWS